MLQKKKSSPSSSPKIKGSPGSTPKQGLQLDNETISWLLSDKDEIYDQSDPILQANLISQTVAGDQANQDLHGNQPTQEKQVNSSQHAQNAQQSSKKSSNSNKFQLRMTVEHVPQNQNNLSFKKGQQLFFIYQNKKEWIIGRKSWNVFTKKQGQKVETVQQSIGDIQFQEPHVSRIQGRILCKDNEFQLCLNQSGIKDATVIVDQQKHYINSDVMIYLKDKFQDLIYIRFLKNQPKESEKMKGKQGILRTPFESSNYQQQYNKFFGSYINNQSEKQVNSQNVYSKIMISNPTNSQQIFLKIDQGSEDQNEIFTIGSGESCNYRQADLLDVHAIVGWDKNGWYISQPPKVDSYISVSVRDLLYFTSNQVILNSHPTNPEKNLVEKHKSIEFEKSGQMRKELKIIHRKFAEDKEESHPILLRTGIRINILNYVFKCEIIEVDEQTYQKYIKSQVAKEEYINFEFNIDKSTQQLEADDERTIDQTDNNRIQKKVNILMKQKYLELLDSWKHRNINAIKITELQRLKGEIIFQNQNCTIYKGKYMDKIVAIKSMKNGFEEFVEQNKTEIELLSLVQHEKILGIQGVCLLNMENYVYCAIVMDLMAEGDMNRISKNQVDIPQLQKVGLMKEVSEGLAFLHSNDILHRDIKPLNVFLKKTKNVWSSKLADLGISIQLKKGENSIKEEYAVGTPRYMAPETIKHGITSKMSDMWQMGLLIYEIFTEQRPWKHLDSSQVSEELNQQNSDPLEVGWEKLITYSEVIQSIKQCLFIDPNKRPTAEQLKQTFLKIEQKEGAIKQNMGNSQEIKQ